MAWRDGLWKAPLFLAVASPILAEVLSGNLPPLAFLPLLPLMLVAYGIPMLLIRDAWVRFGLGVPGLFALGIAYGFVNEALFAKTVFLDANVPIDTFDGYAVGGVNWAWASFIVPWHALHAVLYPIAFTWWLFPSRRAQPWLSRRTSLALLAVMLAVGAAIHTAQDPLRGVAAGTWGTFSFSLLAITVPVLAAVWLPRRPPLLEPGPSTSGMLLLGAAVAPLLFVMAALASNAVPFPVIVLVSVAFYAGFGVLLHRRGGFNAPNALRFALGNELAFVALALLFDAQRGGPPDAIAAHLALELAFVLGVLRLRREERLAGATPV